MRFAATLSYDGTNYSGFQIQLNKKTIQGEIEKSLIKIFKEPIRINYAGRTDSGVHAFGQVIDFKPAFYIKPINLQAALNSILPEDIRVKKIYEVDNSFHSRYSAIAREYVYFIYTGDVLEPSLRNYVWHVRIINVEKIKGIKYLFEGKKDFSFVANEPKDKNCTREVYFLRVRRVKKFVLFHVKANGFLRGMVRNIVGICVAYASNRLQKGMSGNIILNRNLKAFKAPAKGLFLRRVIY